jgi:hypothetical protein
MEERLLAIIKEGHGEIKDLLQAEQELGEWRTRVEALMGEINYYNTQIAMSTLTLVLYEKEIRTPFAVLETEHVELAVEVDEVEKAYRDALQAIEEAKGRITKSDLKQLGGGHWNAVIECDVAPREAGLLRDRLKQLGVLARLEIGRTQETQGGTGRPQEAKIQKNDTQMLISLYNLTNVAPQETVHLDLVCADPESTFKTIGDRVKKSGGRMVSSHLTRTRIDQAQGTLLFHVKSADAPGVLGDLQASGEILRLEVTEDPDQGNSTRSKRGFQVKLLALGAVPPRETTTLVLATRSVPASHQGLVEAVKKLKGRIVQSELNESDRKNGTATLNVEILREDEAGMREAIALAGEVYTRTSSRAQLEDHAVDSKILFNLRLINSLDIPARETVNLKLQVGDVEAQGAALEAAFKEQVVDSRQDRAGSGQRVSSYTIQVPFGELRTALDRVRNLGNVREHSASKNASIPPHALAVGQIEVRMTDEVLLSQESGPGANVRRGLAISLQAASWALMVLMVGVCFVLPLILVIWGALRIRRRWRAKVQPAAPAA